MKINDHLNIQDFQKIIIGNQKIELDNELLQRVEKSFQFLKEFSKNKVIYGVNTGFGPMAQFKINDSDTHQLQYNLIRSHSSGIGNPLPADEVKACMLARLNVLSLGHSGVHDSVIYLLKELINRDVTPIIFEHGGVGASGDLVQLAHLALVLIGEGEVFYRDERKSTKDVLEN
jgi:histidine ammonia-lyase